MVMIEGKGFVPPSPETTHITTAEMTCIIQYSRDINNYKERDDVWGKGLLANASMPMRFNLASDEKPIVAGKLGEYAVWCHATKKFGNIFEPVDFKRRAYGDGGIDLKLKSVCLQIKTRVTSKKNLVRTADKYGRPTPPIHPHVFCSWTGDHFVYILGWMRATDVSRMNIEKSHRGDWENYVVPDNRLLPMTRLWSELEWRAAI